MAAGSNQRNPSTEKGGEGKAPSLTQKPFVIDACWEREAAFSPMESLDKAATLGRPHPGVLTQLKANSRGLGGWILFVINLLFACFCFCVFSVCFGKG